MSLYQTALGELGVVFSHFDADAMPANRTHLV